MVERKPFFVPRQWFAGSGVVFAVDIRRRMMGLRGGTFQGVERTLRA